MPIQSNSDNELARRRECFNHLFDQLKTLKSGAIDGLLKGVALLLAGAGWITTSESARKLLAHDALIRWLAVISIIGYATLVAVGLWRTGRDSQKFARLLKDLDYFPPSYYESLVLSNREKVIYVLVHSLTAIAVAVNVLRTAS